ncbi:hypothetical protein SEPCBS57363_001103 [Sporothrix epigloea]|uniref:Uncharacterized protein n=1 Tax=Sporothrix epigloea TaxID=1892477 RepID=A0ABP0D8F0_9PEZI
MAQISLPLSPLSSHSSLPSLPSLTELGLLGQQQNQLWKAWRSRSSTPPSYDLGWCEKQQSTQRRSRLPTQKQDRPRPPQTPSASPSRDRSPARKRQALCKEAVEGRENKKGNDAIDVSPVCPVSTTVDQELSDTENDENNLFRKGGRDDITTEEAVDDKEAGEAEANNDASDSPDEKKPQWQPGQGHGLRALPPLPPQRLPVQPQDGLHSPRLPVLPWPTTPAKRKRDDSPSPSPSPSPVPLSMLITATDQQVYVLYKFDRVDQLGGQRRGQRGRR